LSDDDLAFIDVDRQRFIARFAPRYGCNETEADGCVDDFQSPSCAVAA
jgi:hypothetical protein